MALIVGGTSQASLEVGATSKGAHTEVKRADGSDVVPVYLGVYTHRFEVVPTVLTAAATYWAMRNTGVVTAYIRRLVLKLGFSGTAAASRSLFELVRFYQGSYSGGTQITPVGAKRVAPTPAVNDGRFSPAGLTAAGILTEAPWLLVGVTNQLAADHVLDWEAIDEQDCLLLAPGEGLALRANTAIVLGAYATGHISWGER